MVSTIVLMALASALGAAPFEAEGSLELVIYDAPDGDTRVDAYLARQGESRLLLHDVFGDILPQPGVVLHVSGTREGDGLWVSEVDVVEPAFELASVGASAGPMVRTLNAVMVGFQNQPLDTSPEQVQQLREYFFGERIDSVASYYAEVSYGKFQFVGDVFIVNLPIDNPSGPDCDGNCVLGAAQSALYTNHPEMVAGFLALMGPFGGSYAQVGSPGLFSGGLAVLNGGPGNAIHEIGHVMGNWHSGSYFCSGAPYFPISEGKCTGWQYGPLSAMGTGGGHFQAGQKRQLGWLSASNTVTATTGVVALAPYEKASTLPLVLQVGPYSIENRQKLGVDRVVTTPGLAFSMRQALYSPGSGYTDFVFLKTDASACSINCDIMLPQGRFFHDPTYEPAPLWIGIVATFDEAAMVLVHTGNEAPLAIGDVRASVDGTRAVVSWTTAVPATSQVELGTVAVALDRATVVDTGLVTEHSVTVTDLPSDAELTFRVVSVAAGTPGYAYGVLTTPPAPVVPPAPEAPPVVEEMPQDDGVDEGSRPSSETFVNGSISGGCASVEPGIACLVLVCGLVRRRRHA